MKINDINTTSVTYALGDRGDPYHGGGTINGEETVVTWNNSSEVKSFDDAKKLPWIMKSANGMEIEIPLPKASRGDILAVDDYGVKKVIATFIKSRDEFIDDMREMASTPMEAKIPSEYGMPRLVRPRIVQ